MKSIDDILKMAANVQEELTKAQANLDTIEIEGVSGGGMVKIKATAKGRVLGVSIDDSLMVVSEKGMLEDLVTAAFNDARAKADTVSGQEMGKMTSGMQLPPGFNASSCRASRAQQRRCAPQSHCRSGGCSLWAQQHRAFLAMVERPRFAPLRLSSIGSHHV
jgi:nucleoid-associated protein EbfC